MLLYHILLGVVLVASAQCKLFRIPLQHGKSPMETMLEVGTDPDQLIWLQHVKPKPKPRTNDTVALWKYLDSEFYGEISIGHPAQLFRVVFDTAWANSWVPSSACSYFNIQCQMKNKYNSGKSSTYIENGKPFVVDFGDSKIVGVLSTDTVHIGHSNILNMTFAEVTTLPWTNIFSKVDGVFGLGFPGLAIDGVTPFFVSMIRQNLIKKPIFSFYMNRDRTTARGGNLILGGSDPSHYTGNFTYVNVTQKMYWKFQMDRVTMDVALNRTIPFCVSGCEVIVDTSTTVITGPSVDVNKLNKYIKATPMWKIGRNKVECNTINKLPPISFIIAGQNFTLKGRDYVQQMTLGGFQVCLSAFVATDFPKPDSSLWTLGAAFVSQFYTEFDMGLNRIGFAKAV